MEYGEFKPSFGDGEYRRFVKDVIDYSERGIEIIGTNLLSISYPEILYSLRKARSEGVAVSVYFNKAPKRVVDWLKGSDVELYQGEKIFADKEYIIRDGNKLIESKLQENAREGFWTTAENNINVLMNAYDALLSEPTTKQIAAMQTEPTGRRVEYREVPEQEIRERIKRHEKLAYEIGRSVRPEKLKDLEVSIRKDRERTL